MRDKITIFGINKRIKYMQKFLGEANLLLDNVRLEIVKRTRSLDAAMKIKSDDKKIEAIPFVKYETELDKVALIRTMQDSGKIKALSFLEDDLDKARIIRTLVDENKKVELIETGIVRGNEAKVRIISSLTDDKLKMKFIKIFDQESINTLSASLTILKEIEDYEGKAEIFESVLETCSPETVIDKIKQQLEILKQIKEDENDDKKIENLSHLNSDFLKSEAIKTIENDEVKIKLINSLDNDASKANVIKSLQDDNKKIEILKDLKDEDNILKVLESIKSDDKLLEAMSFVDYRIIIERIKDDNTQISTMIKMAKNCDELEVYLRQKEFRDGDKIKNKEKFIEAKKILKDIRRCQKEKNEDRKLALIDSIYNDNLKLEIILTLKDQNKKLDILSKLKPEIIKRFRQENDDIDFIKNNLDKFMQLEGVEGIPRSMELLGQMYETNNGVIQSIDFRILNDKYIKTIGVDKINQISCYPYVQEKLLELNDKELRIFSKCIETYSEKDKTNSWTQIAEKILDNVSGYEELIEDIDELKNEDAEMLTRLFQDENVFEIKTLEDLRNYNSIKKQKCEEWIQGGINAKKKAVLEKLYGQSYKYTISIIKKYGEDIENLEDGDYKDYIRSLRSIIEIDDIEVLNKIYSECRETEFVDKIKIENELKSKFAEKFNEGLFKPEDGEMIENGVYEAGTDFKMLITSIGAYFNLDIEDYKKDWNRPAISSQHFCTSYIRNDMLGTAPVNNICYRI